jgi:hypothetical protein
MRRTSFALIAALVLTTIFLPLSTATADPYPCNVTRTFTPPTAHAGNLAFELRHPNGTYAGTVYWNQDPGGDLNGDGVTDPGDSMIAFDGATDGCGIEIRLSGRSPATTRGHNAPYMSPWSTGNLPEDQIFFVDYCIVKGTWEGCVEDAPVVS